MNFGFTAGLPVMFVAVSTPFTIMVLVPYSRAPGEHRRRLLSSQHSYSYEHQCLQITNPYEYE